MSAHTDADATGDADGARDATADADTAGSGVQRLHRNRRLSRALSAASHPSEKLTPETVREIRARYDDGETNRSALAREYDVTQPTIARVLRGDTWSHVGGPTTSDSPPREVSTQ